MHIIKLMSWSLFILAWLALCIAKYNKWRKRIKNCTREVSVKVVDILEKRTARGGMVYKPIFESIDATHQLVIDSALYSSLVTFEIGDTLELLINPEDTKEFLYKDDFLNKGKKADILCCLIPIIIIIGIILTTK